MFLGVSETPPPGYLSEDGETSDHQMNHSMDAGKQRRGRAWPFTALLSLWSRRIGTGRPQGVESPDADSPGTGRFFFLIAIMKPQEFKCMQIIDN